MIGEQSTVKKEDCVCNRQLLLDEHELPQVVLGEGKNVAWTNVGSI